MFAARFSLGRLGVARNAAGLGWARLAIQAGLGGPARISYPSIGEGTGLDTLDLDKWFEDDELLECPACGEQKLIPTPKESMPPVLCLNCGLVVPPSADLPEA